MVAVSGPGAGSPRKAWTALKSDLFCHGEVDTQDMKSELSLQRSVTYPFRLTHFRTGRRLAFRRTWKHIRNDRAAFHIVWWVVSGQAHMRRSHSDETIMPGQAAILSSDHPFQIEQDRGDDDIFASYQILIPTDVFHSHFPKFHGDDLIPMSTSAGSAAMDVIKILFEHGDEMGPAFRHALADSLLMALAEIVTEAVPTVTSATESHVAAIKEFIFMNLSNPDLSSAIVAEHCRISERHLFHILRETGQSYSDILWKGRLERARSVLTAPSTRSVSIGEVALMTGFKSAAHFNRLFKARFGHPPGAYRVRSGEAAIRPQSGDDEFDGSALL